MRCHPSLLLAGLLVLPLSRAHAAATASEYAAMRASIQATQVELQSRWRDAHDQEHRAALRQEARDRVFHILAHDLIPAWEGTPWDFWGTTRIPGQGPIACGYYMSTLLEHAGFGVERVKLAQQASERIIKTLTDEDHIWRTRDVTVERSLQPLEAHGDGLYMVGLDYHVGLLVREGGRTLWCDSSYVLPAAVTCQEPDRAASYASRYRVIGKLLEDPMMDAWLEGRAMPTFTSPLR